MAVDLGVPYAGHITDLARPLDMHDARVAYYDGTGHFDPSLAVNLPKGFVVSRRYLSAAYAAKEIEIAVSIALGRHGFGQHFTPEQPFHIIVVGDPHVENYSTEALKHELSIFADKHAGHMVLDGFTAPVIH